MDRHLQNVYLEEMGEGHTFSISGEGLFFIFLTSPGEGDVIWN